jgi:succinate dehydrogenase / fumarate reductase flavoprotein subunit
VSVHGSNRLGTNSLLDINVFGKRSGIAAAEYAIGADWVEMPEEPEVGVVAELERMRTLPSGERLAHVRRDLQNTMDANAQVFRTEESLIQALKDVRELQARYRNVSVHGSNRLGTNSLLDINVFGKRAGIAAAAYAQTASWVELPDEPTTAVVTEIERMRDAAASERVSDIRRDLQDTMDANAQVFRTEESLRQALTDIRALQERYRNVSVQDKGKVFNTDLLEALELGFLLDISEVVVVGALNRQESRGGHFREDFPKRDDANYMQHTMAYRRPAAGSDRPESQAPSGPGTSAPGTFDIVLDYKPVVMTRYEPMERKY